MPRILPGLTEIRKFFQGATIDPNKRGNHVERQLVEIGEPSFYETRVVEYMQEARRLRERMVLAKGKELSTLKEMYALTMTKAATSLAIASGKVNEPAATKAPKRAGSKDPGKDSAVPPSEGMGGDGDPR